MIIFTDAWAAQREEPSQAQSITNTLKTSSIYLRGMYSIPQHQSTLVFTRVIVMYVQHTNQKKGWRRCPSQRPFQEKKMTCALHGPKAKAHVVPRDKGVKVWLGGKTSHSFTLRVPDQMWCWANEGWGNGLQRCMLHLSRVGLSISKK